LNRYRNLLFTFDHELFLGERSGTIDNCITNPANRILELFEKHKVQNAIFFIDTTYLDRLRKENSMATNRDWNAIKIHLRNIVERGHYLFPHIHPHWLNAEYLPSINQWSLTNLKKYRFANLSIEERSQVWINSMEILDEITSDLEHQVDGFRAGGWCIQPFSDFKPFFIKHGILYDFSVLPGKCAHTNAQYYDYSKAPSKTSYNFESEVVNENKAGSFTQLPISTTFISAKTELYNRFFLKYLWKTGNRSYGDGKGVVPKQTEESTEKCLDNNEQRIGLELLNRPFMKVYKSFLEQNEIMHFISHPKMMSSHNFKMMDFFLTHTKKNYSIETDFKKMITQI
jgi:hypothetical protein